MSCEIPPTSWAEILSSAPSLPACSVRDTMPATGVFVLLAIVQPRSVRPFVTLSTVAFTLPDSA